MIDKINIINQEALSLKNLSNSRKQELDALLKQICFGRILDSSCNLIDLEIPNHILRLQYLQQELQTTQQIVHDLGQKKPVNQVDQTLWVINNQLKVLVKKLKLQIRLPVIYGIRFENLKKQFDDPLLYLDEKKCGMIEKEIFHLVLDRTKLCRSKEINVVKLKGSSEVYSTKSYSQVLKNYERKLASLQQNQSAEGQKISILLDNCLKAYAISQKTFFLTRESNFKLSPMQLQDYWRLYYKTLSTAILINSRIADSQVKMAKIHADFKQIFETYNCTHTPLALLIHDVCKDIMQRIHDLKVDEYAFFCLGHHVHQIVIEIERTSSDDRSYLLKVFNTGEGVYNSIYPHEESSDMGLEYARPLCIDNLSLEAFSYPFIEKLVYLVLKSTDANDFYALLQDFLIRQHQGRWQAHLGEWYPLQIRGTCSYTALDVCIQSHLNWEMSCRFEIIKADMALDKQSRVLAWRVDQYKALPHAKYARALKESQNLFNLVRTVWMKAQKIYQYMRLHPQLQQVGDWPKQLVKMQYYQLS